MSETNQLLDPERYEAELGRISSIEGQAAGTKWIPKQEFQGMYVPALADAIRTLHAQLTAERDRNAALVEALGKSVCSACKGTAEIPNGTDYMACGYCVAEGDFKRLLANLPQAAAVWREKVKAEGAVEALRKLPCTCRTYGTTSEDSTTITCERCRALSEARRMGGGE